jgi:hypothetical protein
MEMTVTESLMRKSTDAILESPRWIEIKSARVITRLIDQIIIYQEYSDGLGGNYYGCLNNLANFQIPFTAPITFKVRALGESLAHSTSASRIGATPQTHPNGLDLLLIGSLRLIYPSREMTTRIVEMDICAGHNAPRLPVNIKYREWYGAQRFTAQEGRILAGLIRASKQQSPLPRIRELAFRTVRSIRKSV